MDIEEKNISPDQMPPLALAYIGDAVYELRVREHLLRQGLTKVQELHRSAVGYVNAVTQSQLVSRLEDSLSEEEAAIWKRGRNAKGGRQPKNTEMIAYRRATGLEALIGYLYLAGREARLGEILDLLIKLADQEPEEG